MSTVIGLGGAGKNTVQDVCRSLQIAGHTTININSESPPPKDLALEESLLIPIPGLRAGIVNLGASAEIWLDQKLKYNNPCFIVCGLGGNTANILPTLLSYCLRRTKSVYPICFLPFAFEGDRKRISGIQSYAIAELLTQCAGHQFIDLALRQVEYQNQPLQLMFTKLSNDVLNYILSYSTVTKA